MCNIVYWFVPGNGNFTLCDLCTSLNSVKIHRDLTSDYTVHICYSELSDAAKSTIFKLADTRFDIKFVRVENLLIYDNSTTKKCWINKLSAITSLPETIDRVLYLDMDILVRTDVSYFYDFDLGDYVFAGFLDYPSLDVRPGDYCNCGFITVNVKKLKTYDMRSWLPYMSNHRWGDQDALNHFCPHTNFPPNLVSFTGGDPNQLLGHDIVTSVLKAKIIHYAGNTKGFSFTTAPAIRRLWFSYVPLVCPPRIFIYGPNVDALGDSVLFASVLKNLEISFPDFEVSVCCLDSTAKVLDACGCKYVRRKGPDSLGYWRIIPYPTYLSDGLPKNKHLLLKSIVQLCKTNAIPLSAFSGLYLARCVGESSIITPEDYVLVPSCEPEKYKSIDKSWYHWPELVKSLSDAGYNVYELNTWVEHPKTYSHSKGIIYTKSLEDTAKLLKNAKFTITTENGLNHWACHNGARTYCIFKSQKRAHPEDLPYASMIPIDCYEDESVDHVMSVIKENEK